jgi:hypothetical protein
MTMNRIQNYFLSAGVIFCLAACSRTDDAPLVLPEGESTQIPGITQELSPEDSLPAAGVIYQWAVRAEASSEFSDPEWSAGKAAGEPDSPGCGDYQFAWASAPSDSIETLVLEYNTPVYPLEIRVIESFNPDQIVKVEVLDPATGGFYAVLQKNPIQVDRPCPYELIILVDGINFMTDTVRLTLDQSQLGLGWNEIDAVELVGFLDQP